MYVVIDKSLTVPILQNFSFHYFCKLQNSDIGIFGYIDVISPEKRLTEVWYIPPETLCIHTNNFSQNFFLSDD
jgi:hypothetical protein